MIQRAQLQAKYSSFSDTAAAVPNMKSPCDKGNKCKTTVQILNKSHYRSTHHSLCLLYSRKCFNLKNNNFEKLGTKSKRFKKRKKQPQKKLRFLKCLIHSHIKSSIVFNELKCDDLCVTSLYFILCLRESSYSTVDAYVYISISITLGY